MDKKMLDAMMGRVQSEPDVPLNAQKVYVRKHLSSLAKDDRIIAAEILLSDGYVASENSEGLSIDLDRLDNKIIMSTYAFVRDKVHNR